MNKNQMDYICKYMLEVEYTYDFSDFFLDIFNNCGSKLEIMYLLGAFHYLNEVSEVGDLSLFKAKVEYNNETYNGIHVCEPWWGFYPAHGPSALCFVPQLKYNNKFRHDFGLFKADDNGGGPPWDLWCAVEIDGYGVHKNTRTKDADRVNSVKYPIYRFQEETTSPLTWFEKLVCEFNGIENINDSIGY